MLRYIVCIGAPQQDIGVFEVVAHCFVGLVFVGQCELPKLFVGEEQ